MVLRAWSPDGPTRRRTTAPRPRALGPRRHRAGQAAARAPGRPARAGCRATARLGARAPTRSSRFLADALRFYMEFHSRFDGFYGAFIHDALAVAAALDPAWCRTEALTVDVELGGTLTTGRDRDRLAARAGDGRPTSMSWWRPTSTRSSTGSSSASEGWRRALPVVAR